MDLNGDGHDDVISGSYWPGHLFVFEGRGNGEYAAGYELTDTQGEKLHAGKPWKTENDPDMDSLAAAPHLVDFDGDGDLDLLVGNIAGRVILIRNDGDSKQPKWGSERTALTAEGGTVIEVNGGDAGPTTADWNGDGLWDLLVGAGDGSVWFYRNEGSAKAPAFAKGKQLLAAAERGHKPLRHDEEPKSHGSRAKLWAGDYDGDGTMDLLVGDFASIKHPEPQLSEEQVATRDRLREERDALSKKLGEIYTEFRDDRDKQQAASKEISEQYSAVYKELQPLEARSEPTGWVWLYRQKPAGESTESTDGQSGGTLVRRNR